jgi:peptidoglycan/LPS O-acetylase OafA/YrhL
VRPETSFIPRLESLRGIAALTVVLHHSWPQYWPSPIVGWDAAALKILKAFSNGTGAVVGFFVISGFVLARSWRQTRRPPDISEIERFGCSPRLSRL